MKCLESVELGTVDNERANHSLVDMNLVQHSDKAILYHQKAWQQMTVVLLYPGDIIELLYQHVKFYQVYVIRNPTNFHKNGWLAQKKGIFCFHNY